MSLDGPSTCKTGAGVPFRVAWMFCGASSCSGGSTHSGMEIDVDGEAAKEECRVRYREIANAAPDRGLRLKSCTSGPIERPGLHASR